MMDECLDKAEVVEWFEDNGYDPIAQLIKPKLTKIRGNANMTALPLDYYFFSNAMHIRVPCSSTIPVPNKTVSP